MKKDRSKIIWLTIVFSLIGIWAALVLDMGMKGGKFFSTLIFIIAGSLLLALACCRYLLPPFAGAVARFLLNQHHEDYEATTHLDKAFCHQTNGDFELALEEFELALELEHTDQKTWLRISDMLCNDLNDPERAASLLARSLNDQEWNMNEHMELLKALAELYHHTLQNHAAAQSIYQLILNKYSGIPFCKTYADKGLNALKSSTETSQYV